MGIKGVSRNDSLLSCAFARPPSALGSRESLATISELDLGAERDVRVWPLHPSLLEEPHCFQVSKGNSPPRNLLAQPLASTALFDSPSSTGNMGGRESLLLLSLSCRERPLDRGPSSPLPA